jgi:hypothetical protein
MLLRPEHALDLADHAERKTEPHWLGLAADFSRRSWACHQASAVLEEDVVAIPGSGSSRRNLSTS